MDPSSGSGATGISKTELTNQELVVGARGFEPRTSCAQGRLLTSRKQFVFSYSIDDLRLSPSAGVCPGVAGCSHLHAGSLQKSLQSRAENGVMT